MMNPKMHRHSFLAMCLLEAIEDEHFVNTKTLMLRHNADPNKIIEERGIAAIHYAAGMDNVNFAEYAMKLILKNEGNPNVQTNDGETPLHIAASWNRQLIVRMLLDHGAEIGIEDAEGNSAINYAIMEGHHQIIEMFKKHIFEEKLANRNHLKTSTEGTPTKQLQTTMKKMHKLTVPTNADLIYTPNRVNYNFDATSPYYINITHRRKAAVVGETADMGISVDPSIGVDRTESKSINYVGNADENMTEEGTVIGTDTNSGSNQTVILRKNLFQLTEENLNKHMESFTKMNRTSLVNKWRGKVLNQSLKRQSILPSDESELDSFIAQFCDALSNSHTSTAISSQNIQETSAPENAAVETGNESFITAQENCLEPNDESVDDYKKIIKSPRNSEELFVQVENYMHTDNESDVVFYEQKCYRNRPKDGRHIDDECTDSNATRTTLASNPSADVTIPLEYDTDDLRRELTMYGQPPGPITKSTKRLYLKKLIKYKRCNKAVMENDRTRCRKFSLELEQTLRPDNKCKWQEIIGKYKCFEMKMSNGFQDGQTKRFREGNLKTSFIYLLIDPRISEKLPVESQVIPKFEAWQRFVPSIFYVGKGKSNRPYAHLYDAIKIYQRMANDEVNKIPTTAKDEYESVKLDRIIDIWKSGKGVICLPIFHNILPVEAYTREAAIIDCIGLQNLTNLKRGDYYGHALSWSMRERKQLGVLLLYKAMHIFMAEGESQLRPDDIKRNGQ